MDTLLSTRRLTLQPLVRQDATRIARLINDIEVARWLTNVPHPYTTADADAFLDRQKDTAGHTYGIHGTEGFMGVVSIVKQLGYWLGRPFWGQGVMSEAARAVVDAYFKAEAGALSSGYLLGNGASARILEKLGFERTEIIESPVPSLGQTVANQQMRLTRSRWEALS